MVEDTTPSIMQTNRQDLLTSTTLEQFIATEGLQASIIDREEYVISVLRWSRRNFIGFSTGKNRNCTSAYANLISSDGIPLS